MARIYFCNNGDIELKSATMAMLACMPDRWSVFLNARPANPGGIDREVDALVVTERAAHLVEFKHREGPVAIDSEGAWRAGQWRMENGSRKESPQEQVLATHDAFKKWLNARGLPDVALAPWVVLEKGNPENRYGGALFPVGRYEWAGKVWIVNGVDNMERWICVREKKERSLQAAPQPDSELIGRLIDSLAAQPLHTMIVQGSVVSLEGGHPLAGVPVRVFTTSATEHVTEVTTNQEGRFEVAGLQVAPFRVDLDLLAAAGWRALPAIEYAGRPGFAPVRIFVANPSLSEVEVRELLARELTRFETELGAARKRMLETEVAIKARLEDIATQLASQEEILLELMTRPHTPSSVRELLEEEIVTLRSEQGELQAWGQTDQDAFVEQSLAPIRSELQALEVRIEQAERRAMEAERHANEAARQATNGATYQEARARVEEKRYLDEKQDEERRREQKERMATALKWSAIVGGAGGIISMQPIPFADNLILTPMQIGLVMFIGSVYGQELNRDLAFKLVGPVGMGFLAQHGTILLYKLIPGAWGLGAITVPAFTLVLGWAAARYFESGQAPTKAERNRVMKRALSAVRDPKMQSQVKRLGATLVAELKERNYRASAEEIKAIIARLGHEGQEIGEYFSTLFAESAEGDASNQQSRPDKIGRAG